MRGTYPQCDVMRSPLTPGVFLPETHDPSLITSQTSHKSWWRDSLQNPCLKLCKAAKATETRKSCGMAKSSPRRSGGVLGGIPEQNIR